MPTYAYILVPTMATMSICILYGTGVVVFYFFFHHIFPCTGYLFSAVGHFHSYYIVYVYNIQYTYIHMICVLYCSEFSLMLIKKGGNRQIKIDRIRFFYSFISNIILFYFLFTVHIKDIRFGMPEIFL